MLKSRKGNGVFPRKSYAILAWAVMSVSGIAAAQSTSGNLVYIEQVGSTNTITIEQVGGGNSVGGTAGTIAVGGNGVTTLIPTAASSSNYGTITGNSNIVGITQTGDSNTAQYNIRGGNNTYNSTVTGNSNQTNLTIGSQGAANNTQNVITETVVGDSNTIIQQVTGTQIASLIYITGNSNQVTNSLLSSRGSVSNTISGNFNITNSQQIDGAGINGHQLVMNTIGDYNSITTQQQGMNDTTVNIATTGSNNTITVRSSSTAISNPVSAIPR